MRERMKKWKICALAGVLAVTVAQGSPESNQKDYDINRAIAERKTYRNRLEKVFSQLTRNSSKDAVTQHLDRSISWIQECIHLLKTSNLDRLHPNWIKNLEQAVNVAPQDPAAIQDALNKTLKILQEALQYEEKYEKTLLCISALQEEIKQIGDICKIAKSARAEGTSENGLAAMIDLLIGEIKNQAKKHNPHLPNIMSDAFLPFVGDAVIHGKRNTQDQLSRLYNRCSAFERLLELYVCALAPQEAQQDWSKSTKWESASKQTLVFYKKEISDLHTQLHTKKINKQYAIIAARINALKQLTRLAFSVGMRKTLSSTLEKAFGQPEDQISSLSMVATLAARDPNYRLIQILVFPPRSGQCTEEQCRQDALEKFFVCEKDSCEIILFYPSLWENVCIKNNNSEKPYLFFHYQKSID